MTVKRMDNVLIVVDDLEAVKAHDIDAVVARMRAHGAELIGDASFAARR